MGQGGIDGHAIYPLSQPLSIRYIWGVYHFPDKIDEEYSILYSLQHLTGVKSKNIPTSSGKGRGFAHLEIFFKAHPVPSRGVPHYYCYSDRVYV